MIRRKWMALPVGTRSILAGAHCWFLHPFFVALAWMRLYGFPFDPRLWVAFFVHDLGYWGKPNMDGDEGETHVKLGAKFMGKYFDHDETREDTVQYGCYGTEAYLDFIDGVQTLKEEKRLLAAVFLEHEGVVIYETRDRKWENFTKFHSRFYSRNAGVAPSRLCAADKLALALTPWWLYLPMVNLTGEIHEYMELSKKRTDAGEPKYASQKLSTNTQRQWYFDVQEYARRWAMEHQDGRPDTWTPKAAGSATA